MLAILSDAVLPVFIMAGIGVFIGRILKPDPRPISRLALYVFAPSLIFSSLSTADIPFRDIVSIFGFLLLWTPAMYAVSWTIAWQLKIRGKARNALLLSTLFPNAVNYGLPVALFAFGQEGLERALLFLVPMALMSGTFAIWVASHGPNSAGLGSLAPLLRIPTFYATIAALAINPLNPTFPHLIDAPLGLLADAAIPTMLMVLGIQLSTVSIREDVMPGSVATFLRLLLSPAIAYPCTLVLGMEGVTQQVVVVLSGMPTAVFTIILATEFDARPNQVTSAVAMTTAMSMVTLTVLIWTVQRLL